MTYIIFDAVILAVVAVFALLGYKRGFVLTLCGFLAMFIGFFSSTFLSNLLCQPVGRLIQPALESAITQILEETADMSRWQLELPTLSPAQDGPDGDDGSALSLPLLPIEEALAAMEESQLYKTFAGTLQEALQEGILTLTSSAATAISAYLAREIARKVLFFVSFVVVSLAWVLISHALDLAFRLPVLSTVNQWAGCAVGVIKGSLLVFVVCWLFRGNLIPDEAIQSTVLLKFFCTHTPMELIAMVAG